MKGKKIREASEKKQTRQFTFVLQDLTSILLIIFFYLLRKSMDRYTSNAEQQAHKRSRESPDDHTGSRDVNAQPSLRIGTDATASAASGAASQAAAASYSQSVSSHQWAAIDLDLDLISKNAARNAEEGAAVGGGGAAAATAPRRGIISLRSRITAQQQQQLEESADVGAAAAPSLLAPSDANCALASAADGAASAKVPPPSSASAAAAANAVKLNTEGRRVLSFGVKKPSAAAATVAAPISATEPAPSRSEATDAPAHAVASSAPTAAVEPPQQAPPPRRMVLSLGAARRAAAPTEEEGSATATTTTDAATSTREGATFDASAARSNEHLSIEGAATAASASAVAALNVSSSSTNNNSNNSKPILTTTTAHPAIIAAGSSSNNGDKTHNNEALRNPAAGDAKAPHDNANATLNSTAADGITSDESEDDAVAEAFANPLPGLDCYNLAASHYSGHLRNSDPRGINSCGADALLSPTAVQTSAAATPIGFGATSRAARVPGIGGAGVFGVFGKHSKVGHAIPPPTTDMGLAPFFHPTAFAELNASVAMALASNLPLSSPNTASAGHGGGFGSIRSGGYGSGAGSSVGMLSAQSPHWGGGGGGGAQSVNSSPAYGVNGGAGAFPRTPVAADGTAFAASPGHHPPTSGGGGGGMAMGSPVPFAMTASGALIGGNGAVVGSTTANNTARSPSLLSPTGGGLISPNTAIGGLYAAGPLSAASPTAANSTSGATTAFVPLPPSLQVPLFVRENRRNNASGGYFAGAGGASDRQRTNLDDALDDNAELLLNHSTTADEEASKMKRREQNEKRKQKEEEDECLFPVVAEDLFATALHPFASTYDYDPRDKMGEGTYGAVYIGYTRPSRARPQRSKVAIKMLKQLPNFEGFPITSVREISVHRYLRSQPESLRSRLLVVDDVRFEHLDQSGAVPSTLTPEMQQELIAMNQRLPPSLQNLPAARRGMVIGEIVVFLVSPFVEHTLTSIRQSLRVHGAGGGGASAAAALSGGGAASQLTSAFQQAFDHRGGSAASSGGGAPLCPLSFNEPFILFIFIQILEGLHQLHRARIMHRDIKEDNILVDRNGGVRICDFGLAVPLEGERAKITPSLIVMFYRPPEMLLGAAQYSTAVDMWSAGCLLAQQFLGVPPFITRDGQPTNELEQLKIIADVLGPLPARLMELAAPEVRTIIANHPQRDLIFERATWAAGSTGAAAGGGGMSNNPNIARQQQQAAAAGGLTTTERFQRFRTWFDQMYKARRRAHINNVALEMPTLDTLIAIFNMLSLDPAARPSAERMLKCNERTCSNRFASNASLVGAADAHATAGGLSMRSMQTAQSLQQALCWSCRGRARAAFMREGVAKLPPPKTHLRPKQQQQAPTAGAGGTLQQQ